MMQAGTERPRFRQDLFAEAVDEQGAKYIDVMNPDTGGVFRFYEVEFSIACAMDGERDVPGLVQWARDELGVTPTTNEVLTVIATLGDLGYLDMGAASRAAAADVPAAPGLAASPGLTRDTVVDAPPVSMPAAAAARTPAAAPKVPTKPVPAGAPPGTTSEVSLDLSEHLAVGKEDVKEALRQSRVMAAVEVPAGLDAPSTPAPVEVKAPDRPLRPVTPAPVARPESRPPERPVEARTPERPVEARAPERPVEVKAPERPVEVKAPERPVTPAPVEPPPVARPEAHKAPVVLPKTPEKQPVPTPADEGRKFPFLLVALIVVVLGVAAFLVWKFVLDKSSDPSSGAVGVAPVAPVAPQQPAPAPTPEPQRPQRPWITTKVEMSSGRPKTIITYFAGVVDWIEASGKEVKSGDIIMMLQGHKALEAQVAAMTKETEKLQADMNAAYKARDEVAQGDEAAFKKVSAKVEAAEKAYQTRADQLTKKTDELEPKYVRLTVDGTLTATRKVGDKVAENAPVATIEPPRQPMATFKLPPEVKIEIGTLAALKMGERLLTCEVFDWEPEVLRVTCPPEAGLTEGAVVSWQLP